MVPGRKGWNPSIFGLKNFNKALSCC